MQDVREWIGFNFLRREFNGGGALVKTIMKSRLPRKKLNLLTGLMIISFSRRTLFHTIILSTDRFWLSLKGIMKILKLYRIKISYCNCTVTNTSLRGRAISESERLKNSVHQEVIRYLTIAINSRIEPSYLILCQKSQAYSCSKESKNVTAGWHFEVFSVFSNFVIGRFEGEGRRRVVVGTDVYSSRKYYIFHEPRGGSACGSNMGTVDSVYSFGQCYCHI